MKTKNRWVLLFSLSLFLPACSTTQPSAQISFGKPVLVEDTLYFGMNTPKGPVTSAQWEVFLREVVTPRFPQGLTAWDAKGQWQKSDGVVQKEGTKVLLLVHPDSADADRALQEVIDLYKKKFHQESVMKVRNHPAVSF